MSASDRESRVLAAVTRVVVGSLCLNFLVYKKKDLDQIISNILFSNIFS